METTIHRAAALITLTITTKTKENPMELIRLASITVALICALIALFLIANTVLSPGYMVLLAAATIVGYFLILNRIPRTSNQQ